MSVGADRGYDTKDFVAGVRALKVTPHVAAKDRFSAIDGRTTRHAGYAVSQRRRKLVEEPFGWMKTVGGLAQAAPSRQGQGVGDLHLHLRRLQPGATAKPAGGAGFDMR